MPFIAYLEYEHERRLFAKCLKYSTLDLTFWKDSGICIATTDHPRAPREKCKEEGVASGFTVHYLLLASFFDQNPDASDFLFTIQTTDFLDKYVSSSQGKSLFIRAVCFLTEPFRNVNFGTPAEVQTSSSAGMSIFRHWKRLVELQNCNFWNFDWRSFKTARRSQVNLTAKLNLNDWTFFGSNIRRFEALPVSFLSPWILIIFEFCINEKTVFTKSGLSSLGKNKR